jgi:hypothetical protein
MKTIKNSLRLISIGILVLIAIFEAPRLQVVYNYLFPTDISILLSYVTVGLVTIVSGLIRHSKLSFVPSLVLSVLLIASYIQTFKATRLEIYNEAKNNVQGVPSEPIKPSSNCRRIEDYEARTSCEKAFASQLKAYATSYEIWSKQKIDIDSKNASFESNIDYTKLYIQILIGFAVSILFSISSWGSSEYLIKSFNTDVPKSNIVTDSIKEIKKEITDKEIIKLRKEGYTYAQLINKYNVSKHRIAKVSAKTNNKKTSKKVAEPKLKLIVNNS